MDHRLLVACLTAVALLAGMAGIVAAGPGGKCLLVTDGTDIFSPDDGATYYSGFPLQSPGGIAIDDATGDVYITDFGVVTAFGGGPDGAVFRFDSHRNVETVYSGAPLGDPYGVLLDSHGDLIVSDFDPWDPNFSNGIIFRIKLDPDGDGRPGPFPVPASAVETVWVGLPLVGPNHLVEDENSDETTDYITPDDSGNVFRVATDGSGVRPMASGIPGPVGIARDGKEGIFYLTSNQTSDIYTLAPDGTVTPFIELPLGSDPLSVTEGKGGNFYVANAVGVFVISSPPEANGQVMVFNRKGEYKVLYEGAPLVNPFDVHPFDCPD
jgi:DNA-binding beta-propeller fold protein YncE